MFYMLISCAYTLQLALIQEVIDDSALLQCLVTNSNWINNFIFCFTEARGKYHHPKSQSELVLVSIDVFCMYFVQIPSPAYCQGSWMPSANKVSLTSVSCAWLFFSLSILKIVRIKLFFISLKLPGHLTALSGNARSKNCFWWALLFTLTVLKRHQQYFVFQKTMGLGVIENKKVKI